MRLTKKQHMAFLNCCQLYIFKNVCIVTCVFLVIKIGALLCFLSGSGIVVPVFIY